MSRSANSAARARRSVKVFGGRQKYQLDTRPCVDDSAGMIVLVVLILLAAFAVASVHFGADSRPLDLAKWGEDQVRPAVSRW